MKKIGLSILVAITIGIGWFALAPSPEAEADAGPHGNYSSTTSKCMACHRAHGALGLTGGGGRLFFAAVSSKTQLCLTCHNGTGSVLDVLNGRKLGTTVGDVETAANAGVGTWVKYSDQSATDYDIWITKQTEPVYTGALVATYTINVRNKTASGISVALTATAGGTAGFTTGSITTSPVTPGANATATATFTVTAASPANLATEIVTLDANCAACTGTKIAQVKSATRFYSTAPTITQGLLGGGFEYYNNSRVTSRHDADPAWSRQNPWGNAGQTLTYAQLASYAAGTPTGSGQTGQRQNAPDLATDKLQCTGCHNPHGTKNYRLLKDTINGTAVEVYAASGGSFTKDETGKDYVNEQYGAKTDGTGAPTGSFGNFCGACHSAYPSNSATIALTGGSPSETHYRHRTEMTMWQWADPRGTTFRSNPETEYYELDSTNAKLPLANNGSAATSSTATISSSSYDAWVVTCLTCHRVHGTSAQITSDTNWAGKSSPAGAPSPAQGDDAPGGAIGPPTGANATSQIFTTLTTDDTTLLRLDNRGVCETCHQWRRETAKTH